MHPVLQALIAVAVAEYCFGEVVRHGGLPIVETEAVG